MYSQLRNKIILAAVIALLVLVFGISGFMIIENYNFIEALYMTVITISTVGFTEVQPLSDKGRLFTVLFIFATLSVFSYYLSQLAGYFFDEELRRIRKIHRMKNKIQNLSAHVIICGYGRNGHEAASVLKRSELTYVVIEKTIDPNSIPDTLYLEADATRDETLIEAGIMKAKALLTTLPDDALNLFVVLTARSLNPHIQIISRALQDSSVKKLKTAGAHNVIMPDKIGGAHMATLVSNPDIEEFIDLISDPSDKTLIKEIESVRAFLLSDFDCWNRTGATVLGVKTNQGDYAINPPPSQKIQQGEKLIIIGNRNQIDDAEKWMRFS